MNFVMLIFIVAVTIMISPVAIADVSKVRTTMNNYFDQYGRVHHKPVTEANLIPSNNGWIYTAYYVKAGGKVDDLEVTRMLCLRQLDSKRFYYVRSPFKESPPISRDEILGMFALGMYPKRHLYNWNFSPYAIPKFSFIELVKQLWQLRPVVISFRKWGYSPVQNIGTAYFFLGFTILTKQRNYFWKNKLDQIYRFAFSVPLTDRHFILQTQGKFNVIYWAISKLDSLFGNDSGIRYLKYGKSKEAMLKEFPADHPIRSL